MEVEPCLELLGDEVEVEEGQTQDIPGFEEPGKKQINDPQTSLWIRSIV